MTIVGITGSCGKTTATLLTGAVLSAKGRCHVQAGASTHHAVARTLLKIASSARFCVHEIGAFERGSIARAARILRPQIGIVTVVGTDHYRVFRGLEGVAREKSALVEILPGTGTAILNIDDPYVREMASRSPAKRLTFGRSAEADVRATDIAGVWPDRLSLTVTHGGQTKRIYTRLVGEQWVPSVLAAISCGIVCGLDLNDCAGAIAAVEPAFGRYSVHTQPGGPIYLFDHKLPYWTIGGSLKFLEGSRAPRKTIVFGTISDHPGSSSQRYRRVARKALAVADRVVFVGRQSGHVEKMRTEALRERLFSFSTVHEASENLAQSALPEELILIRNSMIADHLERIFLSQLDRVVCWRERCGKFRACPECRAYHTPSPPPLGLADSQIASASPIDELPVGAPQGVL